jgi:hypothetical protein
VIHPTEFPQLTFSYNKFSMNDHKKIIQIGGWMRNSYGIYELKSISTIHKYALKGRSMDSYFKPENFNIEEHTEEIEQLYKKIGKYYFCDHIITNKSGICNDDLLNNKYIEGLIKFLRKFEYNKVFVMHYDKLHFTDHILHILHDNYHSVRILEHISNEEYDEILSKNIVFLDIVDASAINTLIECVVRNTPILINKIPAIVEILGENYPFYYSDYKEAMRKLENIRLIKCVHNYMSSMDKSKFKIATFIRSIVNSEIYKHIENKIL